MVFKMQETAYKFITALIIILAMFTFIMAAMLVIEYLRLRRRYKSEKVTVSSLGFDYDNKSGVFKSTLNAWQRSFGYCHFYDASAPLLSMILDSEPIRFFYDDKYWLIEFWKGQYGAALGCEVGVYSTSRRGLRIGDIYDGTFYNCSDDLFEISISLMYKGRAILTLKAEHWWLAGFRAGCFANPEELTANIRIRMEDECMLKAFADALAKAGYSKGSVTKDGHIITIIFDTPKSRQPITRNPFISKIAQTANEKHASAIDTIWEKLDNDNALALKLSRKLHSALMRPIRPKGIINSLFSWAIICNAKKSQI